jgi:hypothetical protein
MHSGDFDIDLDGVVMHLRRSEVESVASGLGEFDSSEEGDLLTLVEALRRLAPNERAPTWELAMRRFGRHKPLAQAAGEIGLDEIVARSLLDRFCHGLTEVPAPEQVAADPSAQLEESRVARVVSAEMLGNAIAHDEPVDVAAAHEAFRQAASDTQHKRGTN